MREESVAEDGQIMASSLRTSLPSREEFLLSNLKALLLDPELRRFDPEVRCRDGGSSPNFRTMRRGGMMSLPSLSVSVDQTPQAVSE